MGCVKKYQSRPASSSSSTPVRSTRILQRLPPRSLQYPSPTLSKTHPHQAQVIPKALPVSPQSFHLRLKIRFGADAKRHARCMVSVLAVVARTEEVGQEQSKARRACRASSVPSESARACKSPSQPGSWQVPWLLERHMPDTAAVMLAIGCRA
jgi:hypothetical protein